MAGKPLIKRLADLQKKKADLDAQIKQIEQEQNKRLRREKQERARIIGMAMLRLIEQGDWSEDKLIGLVSPLIMSGKERRFLGLESSATSTKKIIAENAAAHAKPEGLSEPSTPLDRKPTTPTVIPMASELSRTTTKERLPEITSEADILSEFNL
ncbi:MAG: hypothetical protein AAF959_10740 [Cyanobacteria bacterium P01_D01_bin.56]